MIEDLKLGAKNTNVEGDQIDDTTHLIEEPQSKQQPANVIFVYSKVDKKPELIFEGTYDAKILKDSAVEVLNEMRKNGHSSQEIGDFLQRVCMAFGLPTTIGQSAADPDDVISLIDEVADSISGPEISIGRSDEI